MKHKTRNVLFAALILLLLVAFFWFYNRVDTITVKGCQYYSDEQMKQVVFQNITDYNSVLLYFKYRYFGLPEVPYIEKIDLKRVSRNEIVLKVYEKSLIAGVKYMGEYLYFDKDGYILNTTIEPIEGIPCVLGIDFKDFTLYQKLEVEEPEVFEDILELSQVIRSFELTIDKIHFNTKFEVTLTSKSIQIHLGKRDFYDESIACLSKVLPEALKKSKGGTINMEDYQMGDKVILKTNQGDSEY